MFKMQRKEKERGKSHILLQPERNPKATRLRFLSIVIASLSALVGPSAKCFRDTSQRTLNGILEWHKKGEYCPNLEGTASTNFPREVSTIGRIPLPPLIPPFSENRHQNTDRYQSKWVNAKPSSMASDSAFTLPSCQLTKGVGTLVQTSLHLISFESNTDPSLADGQRSPLPRLLRESQSRSRPFPLPHHLPNENCSRDPPRLPTTQSPRC